MHLMFIYACHICWVFFYKRRFWGVNFPTKYSVPKKELPFLPGFLEFFSDNFLNIIYDFSSYYLFYWDHCKNQFNLFTLDEFYKQPNPGRRITINMYIIQRTLMYLYKRKNYIYYSTDKEVEREDCRGNRGKEKFFQRAWGGAVLLKKGVAWQ